MCCNIIALIQVIPSPDGIEVIKLIIYIYRRGMSSNDSYYSHLQKGDVLKERKAM